MTKTPPDLNNTLTAPNSIVIGKNITVTEPFTFAFGGFDGLPIFSTRLTGAEHAMLYALCTRAVDESPQLEEPEDPQMELPLSPEPVADRTLIIRGYHALDEVKHCQDDMLPHMAENDKIMRNTPVNQWTEEQVRIAEETSKYINQV